MKWIEIVYTKPKKKDLMDVKKRLLDIESVSDITLVGCNINLYVSPACAYSLIFESEAQALIEYGNLKDYCINYGPIPGGLTIESL